MKTFLTIASIVAAFMLISSAFGGGCESDDGVSQQEFQETHLKLNKRIDTIQAKLDQVQWLVEQLDIKVDTIGNRQSRMYNKIIVIEKGIDTLKVGQIILYDEVTQFNTMQQTKSNWANTLIDLLQ